MTDLPNPSKQQQAQHTPGPWRVLQPVTPQPSPTITIKGADDSGIATVWRHSGNRNKLPADANARLTDAAPELLAALKSALDYIEDDCAGNDPITFPPVMHEIRAAIAKAEGR